jgi:hypothetical protein
VFGRHRHTTTDEAPSGACCWGASGDIADGQLCGTHRREVAETARRQGGQGYHSPVAFDGSPMPGWHRIARNRPGSATPGPAEDRESDQ